MKKKVGLIVNPIAGMGGRVALKGSDGKETLRRAIALGATPGSPQRTIEALKRMVRIKDHVELLTYPHEMGEDEAKESGFNPIVMGSIKKGKTSPSDTRKAAKEMAEQVDYCSSQAGMAQPGIFATPSVKVPARHPPRDPFRCLCHQSFYGWRISCSVPARINVPRPRSRGHGYR
jgi:hypothetical protein